MSKSFNIKIVPERKIYYNVDFGIYKCLVDKIVSKPDEESKKALNEYIIIKGNMPELTLEEKYDATVRFVSDPKFGDQFEIIRICMDLDELDEKGQKALLSRLFTENQLKNLYEALDDPYKVLIDADYEKLVQVKGCGTHYAYAWSKRVRDNVFLAKVYAELESYDLTYAMAEKIIEHFKSPELAIQRIKDNPYSLCEVKGIGWKKADAIALRGGIDIYSEKRIGGFIVYYLMTCGENGSSYITSDELMDGIVENIGYDVPDLNIAQAIHSLEDKLWWSEDKQFIGLKRYYDLETHIAEELIRIRDAKSTIKIPSNWKDIINKKEIAQGWEYTDEQVAGIETALKENIVLIHGYAGVGKSSLVDAILLVLKDYDVEICAFSGKAAARVGELAHRDGKTIHRLLGFPARVGGKNGFVHHDENPLLADIIVVDEVSMIGGSLFYYLLRAIKTGSKVILLGDRGQLEAIGECKVASDIIDSNEIPTVWLQKIHRQAQKSAIITESIAIRQGHQIIPKDYVSTETRGELQDLILDTYSDKSNTFYKGMQYVSEFLNNPNYNIMDIQLLAPVKTNGDGSVYNFNNTIQELYNPKSPDKDELIVHLSKNKYYYLRTGDKVINTQNCYKALNVDTGEITPIYNGNMGIIEDIDVENKSMTINFEGIGRIYIDSGQTNAIDLGYAITVHKYQGSQAKIVIVAIDFASYTLLSRELLYTAITRASEKCILLAQNSALRFAVDHEKTSQKKTHLCKLLYSLSNPELIF